MIITKLPYEEDMFEDISNNGAIIDMSKNELDIRTTFIYLRNTNFNNIKFDFSSYSSQQKIQFIYEYLMSDIQFDNPDIILTIFSICLTYLNIQNNYDNILNLEQKQLFISKYKDIVQNIIAFIRNSYLCLAYNTYKDDIDINVQIQTLSVNKNIYNIFKCQDIILLFSDNTTDAIFFKQYQNTKLQYIITQSEIGCFYSYLFNKPQDQVISKINQLYSLNI